jgi:hypothetical protein
MALAALIIWSCPTGVRGWLAFTSSETGAVLHKVQVHGWSPGVYGISEAVAHSGARGKSAGGHGILPHWRRCACGCCGVWMPIMTALKTPCAAWAASGRAVSSVVRSVLPVLRLGLASLLLVLIAWPQAVQAERVRVRAASDVGLPLSQGRQQALERGWPRPCWLTHCGFCPMPRLKSVWTPCART